ncbi:glycoside hydrolase family 5 protein [Clostridium sp. 19966]|uniref:glycoside hydrolase family 5 protein n=1 Tax=Clostridium sp. 19966 TaxID=2768166 RepID=UPI0028DDF705|nr:glycoside hydrolase family 5 protein [Clostridium sp. 19966]MDT8717374.1 glycoside hydrolase family 5 protein [Clostridium sp. 19966]
MPRIKSIKIFLVTMMFSLTTILSGWSSAVLASSSLTSDFNQLNATQIVSDMGAGWNLGNQLEANSNGVPSETAWGNPTVTQALIQKVKAAGFKTIRIPVSYLNKIGNAPNYTIDASWLSRIKGVVDYAYSQGLYVIINIHGDGYTSVSGSWLLCNSNDQTTIKAKYQKVWQQIANQFINYDEHLIFESMNEEFDGTYGTPNTTYYSNINAYNQIFVDTVRQTGGNNSARWLLIPGWNTNIDYTAGNYGFVLPTDNYRSSTIPSSEKRIMISAHYYSPWDFCGDQSGTITQWGATATNSSKKSTWGQEDYLNSEFQSMYNKFVAQGYPVVIGEYGAVDKTSADSTNNTYRAAFAKAVCSTAKKYKSVPVYWDNGYNGQYGFGLFNRSTYAITQQGIINAIMSGINS